MSNNCKDAILFQQSVPGMGCLSIRHLQLNNDVPLIHSWVRMPYARYWGMQGYSQAQVENEYRQICQNAEVFIGLLNQQPVFVMERYHPRDDAVAKHYDVQDGDRGMHILIAPTDKPIAGFSWAVFRTVMDFIFSDAHVSRVVVEPDAANDKIHTLNARAGFEFQRLIELPHKIARLEFCTRTSYQAALKRDGHCIISDNNDVLTTDHLTPDLWQTANCMLLAKAIAEYAHELLIHPQQEGQDCYRLNLDDITYRFHAERLALDHWVVEPSSITKMNKEGEVMPDLLSFVIEFAPQLDISDQVIPTYIEELSSTLNGLAYRIAHAPSVEVLCNSDFQTIEAAMIEGHPSFVANSGRIGYGIDDYYRYAPEVAADVHLLWLAVHKSRAEFSACRGVTDLMLFQQELGHEVLHDFQSLLAQQGLDWGNYLLMPVHPWQWRNKLVTVFTADIAERNIVLLGRSQDVYQAQQSLRTFFNCSSPAKCYVKTALSILNMGFMRGLSPAYMRSTPAINDWIYHLLNHDRYLADKGFRILRELAAVGYRHRHFDHAGMPETQYKKMLSCLWRENPLPLIEKHQRLMTMAGLLHVDGDGQALLVEMIKASGLNTTQWLARYMDSYLAPLLHCFYAHDLVFMPHGENLILVLEQHTPVAVFMKDIGEESAVLNPDLVLAEEIQRLSIKVPEEHKVLCILTDVFDGFFRYLSALLQTKHGYPQKQFWRQVADCIIHYQQQHPEFNDKFQRYNLFVPQYSRCCLNRLQMANNQQMLDLANPSQGIQMVGVLDNPIAEFSPRALNVETKAAVEQKASAERALDIEHR